MADMTTLRPVPAPIPDETWRLVKGWLARALAECAAIETISEVKRSIEDRRRQLWLVDSGLLITGVVVTETYPTARGETCGVPYAAGRGMALVIDEVLKQIETWARSEGCTRVEAIGRPGWTRTLKSHGWAPRLVHMAKEIS